MPPSPPTAPPIAADDEGGERPSQALVEAELERIAASAPFRRATRHIRFLRHLVQGTLGGDMAALREIALGVQVFHRSSARFDPRQDSIVRVEARRLRQKLAAYYADEGLDARLQFELPLGGYRIEFRRRAAGTLARTSIAVHALINATGDAALDTAVHGMSIELVSALTRLNGIRVVADDQAPAEGAALRKRARLLGVNSVVSGSVTPGPRLELRLIEADDGALVWTRQIALQLDHALDALEPLARGVIAELQRAAAQQQLQRIRLAGKAPLVRGAPSAEVRERMTLARAALGRGTLEATKKAVQLAEAAVATAGLHAPAFALLADALIASVGLTAVPARPTMEAAREAAAQAVALDAEMAEGHGALGTIAFSFDRRWPEAEAHLLRALRFGPGEARGHARYGWALMMSRRFDEARSAYAEARELDPLSLLYRAHGGLIELYARDYPRAASAFDAVLEVAPDHLVAGSLAAALHLYAGRIEAGLAAYRALLARFPKLSIGRCGLGQALALAGDEAGARRELAWLSATYDAGYLSPYQIAMVQARLGEADEALDWLARAAELRDFNFVCAGVDPAFDTLRRDARFAALLQAEGLGSATG